MRRITIAIMAGALVLTACQSASEVLTEQIIEQVEGVDNVEIDTDTGQISVETEDGKVTVGGGEVPDGFPVPFPSGGEVTSVFSSPDGAAVTVTYPSANYDELVAFYGDWTDGQTGEWNASSNTFTSGDQTTRTNSWSGDTSTDSVNIGVIDCFDISGDNTDQYNAVCVNIVTDAS